MLYKCSPFSILVDHLKLEEAGLNSPIPHYTHAMRALFDKFKCNDSTAFQKFSLKIQSLVGFLQTLGPEGEIEPNCGSHIAHPLNKLPLEQTADF